MKKIYAQHYAGVVSEIIETEIDINTLYTPEFVSTLLEVTDRDPAVIPGWQVTQNPDGSWYIGPYIPTSDDVLASNSLLLQQENQLASAQKAALTNRVGTLQDAVDLDMATAEEVAELPTRQAQLLEWKKYAIFLGRVKNQDGWHMVVEWPVQPSEGMDLTVSAVAGKSAETK